MGFVYHRTVSDELTDKEMIADTETFSIVHQYLAKHSDNVILPESFERTIAFAQRIVGSEYDYYIQTP